jgi:glutathione S-transferase
MLKPCVFGADYSVYVRIVRLTLEEKNVDYDLKPVDVFAKEGPPASYLERQPFGRIPAFEHDGFQLYETGAITRYIDEAFAGPRLQPVDPRQRARVNQIIGVADAYIYPTLVWGVYVESVSKRRRGEIPNEARLAAALAKAPTCLKALSDIIPEADWLVGSALTLADLHLAPMFYYFVLAPEGREMTASYPKLKSWWARIEDRASMQRTKPTT